MPSQLALGMDVRRINLLDSSQGLPPIKPPVHTDSDNLQWGSGEHVIEWGSGETKIQWFPSSS